MLSTATLHSIHKINGENKIINPQVIIQGYQRIKFISFQFNIPQACQFNKINRAV